MCSSPRYGRTGKGWVVEERRGWREGAYNSSHSTGSARQLAPNRPAQTTDYTLMLVFTFFHLLSLTFAHLIFVLYVILSITLYIM